MRYSFSLSLLAVAVCAGCASQNSDAPVISSSEPTARTTGLRAPYQPSPASSFQRVDGADPFTQPPTQRPGSDIVLGESHASRKVPTTFERSNGNVPAAVTSLYYTDEKSAVSLQGSHRLPKAADAARADLDTGYVSLNVRERLRGSLPLLSANGANYALVKSGQQNFLTIRNTLRQPVEVLLAVNDRSLTDGQSASYRKRGVVIDPGETASVGAQFDQPQGQITMALFLGVAGR